MKVERIRCLSRFAWAIIATLVAGSSAYADQTVGGVNWLDPLSYQKPAFVPITIPTIVTNYYIDLTSGSDSGTCGTGTGNPCKTLRGLVDRSLSGLRGNTSDGAAAVNIRGAGSGAWYIFNNTFAGTPGKEILIRPWGTAVVTFSRGGQNQGLNSGPAVHDIIIDGGDPATGNMLFKFVADYAACGGPCFVSNFGGNNITVSRSQFTATSATGSGWVYLVAVCGENGLTCSNVKFINNEFYDCKTGSNQCSSIYTGPCDANGGCAVNNVLIQNNVIRNMGGEGMEINPRIASTGVTITGNAIHNVGYGTCNDGGTRSCRPGIVLNINQSGAVNDVVITNNLMWDLSSGCIWEKSGANGTHAPKIYNNACYDYGKGTVTNGEPQGIESAGMGSVAFIQDNILYAPNGTNPYGASMNPQVSSNNLCGSGKSCGSSPKTWSAATVIATAQTDANFMKIAASSEAFGGGTNMFAAGVTVDYAGLSRTSFGAFDIGAFRVPASGAAPTAPTNLRIVP